MASDGWVHCGQVKDGLFQEGRKVSVNGKEKVLRLTNKKLRSDGIVLEKIELFSEGGCTKDFLKDGVRIDTIIPRLNDA